MPKYTSSQSVRDGIIADYEHHRTVSLISMVTLLAGGLLSIGQDTEIMQFLLSSFMLAVSVLLLFNANGDMHEQLKQIKKPMVLENGEFNAIQQVRKHNSNAFLFSLIILFVSAISMYIHVDLSLSNSGDFSGGMWGVIGIMCWFIIHSIGDIFRIIRFLGLSEQKVRIRFALKQQAKGGNGA